MKRSGGKKTAFVPRAVYAVSLAGMGVVPFVASVAMTASLEQGCGSSGNGAEAGVACVCFADGGSSCGQFCGMGVAATCFTDPHLPFCDGGDAGDTGRSETSLPEGGVADIGFSDVRMDGLAVADAFGEGGPDGGAG